MLSEACTSDTSYSPFDGLWDSHVLLKIKHSGLSWLQIHSQKNQTKTETICGWWIKMTMAMSKDMRVHLTRKSGYFYGIERLKIIIGIMTDNITANLPWTVRVVTNFYEIHTTSEILVLIIFTHASITWERLRHLLLWDNAFLCNSTYQINWISLTSLF